MSFVIAAVGTATALTVYGDISSAKDQADLDKARATVAEQQAAELELRNQANAALIEQQAYRQKMQFGSSYAASGKSGVGVGSQLQIQNQADEQNMIQNTEAKFQESMLNQQAGIDTTLASETETAGYISAGAAVLGGASKALGAANAGGNNPGYGAPGQGLGSYPKYSVGAGITSPGAMGGG